MLAGKLVLPRISGWTKPGLLIKVLQLLLSLKLMMPGRAAQGPRAQEAQGQDDLLHDHDRVESVQQGW